MSKPNKVFISYSHDSDAHRQFVLKFSDKLRDEGLDCWIDQYEDFPKNGWQQWMEKQVESADFVLLICTPLYLKRYKGEDSEGGRGVTFEGMIISQTLYDAHYKNTKFIAVIPDDGNINNVPLALKDFTNYRIYENYQKLYRLLTNQPATPAREIGSTRTLSEDRANNDVNQSEQSKINNRYALWLSFYIQQTKEKIQSKCLTTGNQQINSVPIAELLPFQSDMPGQLVSMFELLFGNGDNWLEFLHQFSETENINHPEDARIRIRIMTDDPDLAMLLWQQMQFPSLNKPVFEYGWMIETGPNLRHYQPGFIPLGINTPLIIIPTNQQHNISAGQHYSLVHDYMNSYLGIDGMIPRISTAQQLQRAIEHEQPDFIYFYCCIINDQLQLDNSQISLQELAKWIKQAELYPSVIFNLIGATQLTYPQLLLETTRLVWLQTIRSQIKARNEYEQSLLNVLEKLTNNEDLAELISKENIINQQSAYLWLNGRSPLLNRANDAGHVKQQLRVALLRVMLGRKELKGSMNNEISNSAHRDSRNVLVYAVSGDSKACPFEFPAQIRQTMQWDDPDRSSPVIPFDFYASIDADQEPYAYIEDRLSKGLLHGNSEIESIFQKERERRGPVNQDCCIMLNWLITVAPQSIDSIDDWITQWCQLIRDFIVGNVPEHCVLVSSACLQVEQENQAQQVHDIANSSIRAADIQQLQLIGIKEALGKLDVTEISDFLQYHLRWRRDLKLDDHTIKPHEYASWIVQNTAGVFEPTVSFIWQQYQRDYQDYPQIQ